MADEMELLKEWIKTSKNIVFFGGAGVSTESNIPDFRSTDGLYNQEYAYPPETILSHSFYKKKPEEFFRFYRNKMLFPNAQPNAAHKALARLEQQGKLKAVITQNIDGLHQKAGSREVLELHGSVFRNYCEHCGRFYSLEDLMEKKELVPKCNCGGIIKPDVVLYEESLNQKQACFNQYGSDSEGWHSRFDYKKKDRRGTFRGSRVNFYRPVLGV